MLLLSAHNMEVFIRAENVGFSWVFWGFVLCVSKSSFTRDLKFILRDYVLGVFLGEGCNRNKDGVGNGIGKFSGHDNVSLKGFVMEELFHRSYQKVKEVFCCINMVEVRENRT